MVSPQQLRHPFLAYIELLVVEGSELAKRKGPTLFC